MVFNPKKKSRARVKILDREVDDWRAGVRDYETVVQNFRMISKGKENLWPAKGLKTSISCIAADDKGNILFILTRKPFTVHEFNIILMKLPLSIITAMYTEGGAETSLYVKSGKINKEFGQGWPIPNALGISRKK